VRRIPILYIPLFSFQILVFISLWSIFLVPCITKLTNQERQQQLSVPLTRHSANLHLQHKLLRVTKSIPPALPLLQSPVRHTPLLRISNAFIAPLPMAAVSQTPASPPPQSLASRGRRPALIPHNADLSISLSAASAALGMASYSPNRERQRSGGVLWVVPGSAPPPPPPPQWDSQGQSRGRSTAEWDQDPMEIDCDDGDGHDERVERELVRGLVAKDVFSWVCIKNI